MAEAEQSIFRHISDVDVWGTRDRNFFTFLLLSIFGGFFALDHIYLRSYPTAVQKVALNFFGFGLWYFWDLLQLFTEGQTVREKGLSSPFDWTQGIGRGVFSEPEDRKNPVLAAKSYILWSFLAIFGGFFALDKFYIGDYWHGLVKLVSIFSPIFLFGFLWVGWDAFHAFFMTKDVLSGAISLPPPLTWFGFSETPGQIFLPGGVDQNGGSGISGIAKSIMGMSSDKVENMVGLITTAPLMSVVSKFTNKLDELKSKVAVPTPQTIGAGLTSAAAAALPSAAAALPSAAAALPGVPAGLSTALLNRSVATA